MNLPEAKTRLDLMNNFTFKIHKLNEFLNQEYYKFYRHLYSQKFGDDQIRKNEDAVFNEVKDLDIAELYPKYDELFNKKYKYTLYNSTALKINYSSYCKWR